MPPFAAVAAHRSVGYGVSVMLGLQGRGLCDKGDVLLCNSGAHFFRRRVQSGTCITGLHPASGRNGSRDQPEAGDLTQAAAIPKLTITKSNLTFPGKANVGFEAG